MFCDILFWGGPLSKFAKQVRGSISNEQGQNKGQVKGV
jgi:hypothetical protein